MSPNAQSLKPKKIIFPKIDQSKIVYNPYTKQYMTKHKKTHKQTLQRQPILRYSSHQDNDSAWIGDDMSTPPAHNLTRFWMQNCQGMVTAQDINRYHYEMQKYIDNNIHYLAFSETRINSAHTQTVYEIEHGFNHLVSHGRIDVLNTPKFSSNSAYQPRGVASAFHGRISNRFTKTIRDSVGRWITHEFVGREKPLRVYNVYRVNPKNAKADTSAWAQQKRHLQEHDISTDPREHVITALLEDIELSIQNGCSIILMGDMNENINSREKTNQKLLTLGLTNLMQHMLHTQDLPRTHKRGTQAIDHVWVTSSLINSVSRAGYAPFDFLGSSDHRGICFDVNLDELLDFNIVPLQSIQHRRLQSNIPKRVNKYIKMLDKKWKAFNIEKRLETIHNNIRNNDISTLETDLNNLDQNICDAMKHAERKCSKVPGRVSAHWSPTFHQALDRVHKTRTARNKSQYVVPGTSLVDALITYRNAQNEYEEALKHYREVKKNTESIRKTDMMKLAEDRAKENNGSTDVEYNKIIHLEQETKSNRKIKYVIKTNTRAGVTSILIPSPTSYSDPSINPLDVDAMWDRITPQNGRDISTWDRITDRKEMERILLRWQQLHFLQANETPLTTDAWKHCFEDPTFHDEVLHGRYDPPSHLHPTTREVLKHMQRLENVEEFEFKTTFEEFKQFIKGSKEKTSTSPSGRHYGHYKALLHGGSKYLATIHSILETAIQHNIILRRWKHTTTTLIEKEPGLPYVHRMRAIHIIEAEVQFLAKNFYITKLMKHAESKNLITDEQYGGRSRRQAQSAVINKVLYYNLSHQMLMPSAYMDDDARACYDRIITPLSSLECRKWGAPYKLAQFTNKFIESQTYALRTGHGISEGTYTYTNDDPIQGSGQGIGWAGPRWLCSGDTCSRIMSEANSGMKFADPTYSLKVRKQGDYFVDDTATGVTLNTLKQDQRDIFEQLQCLEQLHSDVLFSMGHKLAIDKCSFYAADFNRGKYKHEFKLIHELPGSLHVRETHTSNPIPVKRLQPFQAHKTLGCHIALNFNQKMQFRKLNDKLLDWNTKMKSSFLSATEKIKSYKTFTAKGVEYVLPTSSLSEKQCQDLDKLVTPILYNAHGIQRNNSKCVLYSPVKYGGIGHKSIWHMQGINKLKFFFTHYRRHDTTGRLMKISMRWTQLEAGTSKPFYQYNFKQLAPLLTPTWMIHLWEYLSSCNSTISEHAPWVYDLPCENDFFLMDIVLDANIPVEQKIIFNEIRMHLRILTASDIIVLGSGSSVHPNVFKGIRFRPSSLLWPNTQKFPRRWLKVWNTILQTYIIPKIRNTPIGNYLRSPHQTWKTKATLDGLFIHDGSCTYKKFSRTRRSKYIPTSETIDCQMSADIVFNNNEPVLLGSKDTTGLINTNQMHQGTAWEYYQQAPKWQKLLWGNIDLTPEKLSEIITHFSNNNINAAGDGSVKRGKAAQAWCLFRKDTYEILLEGVATVNGDPDHITSMRPETISSIAAGSFLNLIASTLDHLTSDVTFFSDNEATVINSARTLLHDVGSVLEDDIDVTLQNAKLVKNTKFTYRLSHLHGHQDDHNDEDDLSPEAIINTRMDKLVGEHVERLIRDDTNTQEPGVFPTQQISILINGKRISSHLEDRLIFEYYKDDLEKHYQNVVHLPKSQFKNIQWNALRLSLRNNPKFDQTVKAIHSQWQTKHVCERWNLTDNAKCPLCECDDETWTHVLQCNSVHMERVRNEFVTKISKEMEALKTNATLHKHIMAMIRAWTTGHDIPRVKHSFLFPSSHLQQAHLAQAMIGFDLFFKGLITPKWGIIQEIDYDYQHLPSNFNRIRWEKKLINLLHGFLTEMWAERCRIVHAANLESEELRYRQRAWEYLNEIKSKQWMMNHDGKHLLDRDENYFRTSNILTIRTWYDNITAALEYSDRRNKSIVSDIRNFFTREIGFVQLRTRMRRTNTTATATLQRLNNTVQQNISNLFSFTPSLGH